MEQLSSPPIRGLELPQVQVVGPWRTRRPTRKAIVGGRFYVYGQAETLRPPIDWEADPHGSRTWRFELQTLTWLKEALARYSVGADVEMLAVARDVVLDWARAHLRSNGDAGEFVWYDMAVGLRAPYVAYVLRACTAEGVLSADEAELLREAVDRHGAELVDGASYSAGSNHGLFQDEGLYLLSRLLPELPAAQAWGELALMRMRATLEESVDFDEGVHLEHSPAYQLAIVNLLARLARAGDLPELGDLLGRMRRTAAWQVTPAGRTVQLGDTDDLPAPSWARETAASLDGARLLRRGGQAFVRAGDSYLAVGAAYHGGAHKHSDDTGFVLVENRRVVLGDAGRWGYYEEEAHRLHARSAAAHNVLTVDGRDFEWRDAEPYGSGLETVEEEEGWYAIAMRNPLLARQGVDHRRVLFYRPGEALLVRDEVRAEDEHEYARHFHFGPELEAEADGHGGVTVRAEGIAARLTDLGEETQLSLTRGREEPSPLGWAYPGDRERTAVWTATLRSRAGTATLTAALSLNGEAPSLPPASLERQVAAS